MRLKIIVVLLLASVAAARLRNRPRNERIDKWESREDRNRDRVKFRYFDSSSDSQSGSFEKGDKQRYRYDMSDSSDMSDSWETSDSADMSDSSGLSDSSPDMSRSSGLRDYDRNRKNRYKNRETASEDSRSESREYARRKPAKGWSSSESWSSESESDSRSEYSSDSDESRNWRRNGRKPWERSSDSDSLEQRRRGYRGRFDSDSSDSSGSYSSESSDISSRDSHYRFSSESESEEKRGRRRFGSDSSSESWEASESDSWSDGISDERGRYSGTSSESSSWESGSSSSSGSGSNSFERGYNNRRRFYGSFGSDSDESYSSEESAERSKNSDSRSYESDSQSYESDSRSYESDSRSYESDSRSFDSDSRSYGSESDSDERKYKWRSSVSDSDSDSFSRSEEKSLRNYGKYNSDSDSSDSSGSFGYDSDSDSRDKSYSGSSEKGKEYFKGQPPRNRKGSEEDSAESWYPEAMPVRSGVRGKVGPSDRKRLGKTDPRPVYDEPKKVKTADSYVERTKRNKISDYHEKDECIEVCGKSRSGKKDPCDCHAGKIDCKAEKLGDADICLSNDFMSSKTGRSFIVRELDLSGNAIEVLDRDFVLPEHNGTVEVVDVSRNVIYDIEDGTFEYFPKLRRLELNNNKLSFLYPKIFKGLERLQVLDLRDNDIQDLSGSPFKHLQDLEVLNLAGNPITTIDESTFKGLTKLRVLRIDDTELNMVHENWFKDLASLDVLSLKNNQFRIVPSIHKMENLKTLDLSGNPIQELPSNCFTGLNGLETLILTYMPGFWYVNSCAFCGLPSLEELTMAHNKDLTEVKADAFGPDMAFTALEDVDLSDNALTTISENFLPWEDINQIDLSNNPFYCDCSMSWVMEFGLSMADPVCKSPKKFGGRKIADLSYEDFDCESHETKSKLTQRMNNSVRSGNASGANVTYIVLSTIVGVLLFVAFVYFALIRSRRRNLEKMKYQYRNLSMREEGKPEIIPDPVEL